MLRFKLKWPKSHTHTKKKVLLRKIKKTTMERQTCVNTKKYTKINKSHKKDTLQLKSGKEYKINKKKISSI